MGDYLGIILIICLYHNDDNPGNAEHAGKDENDENGDNDANDANDDNDENYDNGNLQKKLWMNEKTSDSKKKKNVICTCKPVHQYIILNYIL